MYDLSKKEKIKKNPLKKFGKKSAKFPKREQTKK